MAYQKFKKETFRLFGAALVLAFLSAFYQNCMWVEVSGNNTIQEIH